MGKQGHITRNSISKKRMERHKKANGGQGSRLFRRLERKQERIHVCSRDDEGEITSEYTTDTSPYWRKPEGS